MDPITIGLILVAVKALAVAAVVYLAVCALAEIYDWFRNRESLVNDKAIAVTVTNALSSGKYRIVQGIFDKDKKTFADVRKIEADKLDDELAEVHAHHEVVIYN